jgi:hypothetical protein
MVEVLYTSQFSGAISEEIFTTETRREKGEEDREG